MPRSIAGLLVGLCLAEILTMLGIAAFAALLPEFSVQWGLSSTEAGWIGSAYFVGYTLTVPVLVSLTDRIDPARIFVASLLVTAVAHLGFAVAVIGVVLSSQYAVERDVRMSPGDSHEIAGYRFEFTELARVRGPNFVADEARIAVARSAGGPPIARLDAQKRRYLASGQVMTEAAIDAGLFRDIFVAMGEPLDGGAWAVRLHYKPFVRWIWGGAAAMALGGFVTLADRRYRGAARRRVRARAGEVVGGVA